MAIEGPHFVAQGEAQRLVHRGRAREGGVRVAREDLVKTIRRSDAQAMTNELGDLDYPLGKI